MEEKQVILKLLKILNKKEEKPPEKYKKIWKCLICDELFPKNQVLHDTFIVYMKTISKRRSSVLNYQNTPS